MALNLAEIARLLLLAPSQRSNAEADLLVRMTHSLKFFHDQPAHVRFACCQAMKVAHFTKGTTVFNFGDTGDSFCVILKGTVEVLVPPAKPRKTSIGSRGALAEEVHVATLTAGMSFGELALLNNQPRAATIRTKTSVTLALLYKDDYNRILRAQHDTQLREKIKFLRSFPIFSDWTYLSLSKLTYFFLENSYKKGDVLYREHEPVQYIFFLKSGEFQLYKQITTEKPSRSLFHRIRPKAGPKPRPVMIKIGREVLGYAEAASNSGYQYSCVCVSDQGVVWAVSKDDWLKRCQHPLCDQYLKARAEVEKGFIRSRLSELARAESLLQSFDGGTPSVTGSEGSCEPERSKSTARMKGRQRDPYENLVLVPSKVIASRFGQHARNSSAMPKLHRHSHIQGRASRLALETLSFPR